MHAPEYIKASCVKDAAIRAAYHWMADSLRYNGIDTTPHNPNREYHHFFWCGMREIHVWETPPPDLNEPDSHREPKNWTFPAHLYSLTFQPIEQSVQCERDMRGLWEVETIVEYKLKVLAINAEDAVRFADRKFGFKETNCYTPEYGGEYEGWYIYTVGARRWQARLLEPRLVSDSYREAQGCTHE